MLDLILKDFVIQKKRFRTYILLSVFFAVWFSVWGQQEMLLGIATFPVIYGFANNALYEDEKNNTLRLLASLPIRKEMLVYCRYISIALTAAGTIGVYWLLGRLLPASGIRNRGETLQVSTLVISACAFLFLLSIYLPLAFKLGYIKAAGLNRFILIGVFAFFGAGGIALKEFGGGRQPAWLLDLVHNVDSLDPRIILAVVSISALLAYLLSMYTAVRFFRKRNLFK